MEYPQTLNINVENILGNQDVQMSTFILHDTITKDKKRFYYN